MPQGNVQQETLLRLGAFLRRELPPELREAIGRHFPLAEVLEPGESWLEREEVPEHLRQAAEQGRWQYVEEYLSLLALWERGGIVLAPEALPQQGTEADRQPDPAP